MGQHHKFFTFLSISFFCNVHLHLSGGLRENAMDRNLFYDKEWKKL